MPTTKSIFYDIRLYVSDKSKLESVYKKTLRFLCKNSEFFEFSDDEVDFLKHYINKFKCRIAPIYHKEVLADGRETYYIVFSLNLRVYGSKLQIIFYWGDHIKKDLEFMYMTYRKRGIINS
nr:MAG TPA: hypothetical protein [Crassvirales sp.]